MPPKNGAGIEMKVGRLCGDVAGLQTDQDRVENRLNNHGERIGALERKLFFVSGVAAAVGAIAGSTGGSLLSKLFAGASVAAEAAAAVLP